MTCDHLLQYCAPNTTEIPVKKAVLIELAFYFVAGDLYPLAFGSNSLDLGTLTLKADSLQKLNPLGGFDRICILGLRAGGLAFFFNRGFAAWAAAAASSRPTK